MAKGDWWFKFEWDRWLGDEKLNLCSLETQGFWIRCIAIMNRAGVCELTGTIDELRRLLGCLPEELTRCCQELKRTNAADVRFGNGEVSILSRAIQKDLKSKELNRLYVAKHREKSERKADVRTQSNSIEIEQDKEEEEEEEKETKPEPADKKIKLPVTFQPDSEMIEWASAECPGLDVSAETEEFVTFWVDIATKNHRRTVRGWKQTWKNRMKDQFKRFGVRPNGTHQKQSERDKSAQRTINAERMANAIAAGDTETLDAIFGGNGQGNSTGYLTS